MKIFIDAGHGGSRSGAVNHASGRMEKDATLQIAMRLKAFLVARGFTVAMSRETDEHVELIDRCKMANKWCADAFVSIHLNAPGQVFGAETWHYASARARTRELAVRVQNALIASTGAKDRGVKRTETFTTCKHTLMPSIVVECGFISCDEECKKCFTPAYQSQIAQGIANGLCDWRRYMES